MSTSTTYEPLPGLHVNGELTLDENLGDLTGVVISHRAYKLSLNGRPAAAIDGLTGDQRFFFGWSQHWHAKEQDDFTASAGADQRPLA